MEFDIISFGERIQETRQLRGLTQEQLAECVGMSRENISRLERGVRTCSFEFLIKLSAALNISTDFLLTGRTTDRDELRESLRRISERLTSISKTL